MNYAVILNGRQQGIVGEEGRAEMLRNGTKATFVALDLTDGEKFDILLAEGWTAQSADDHIHGACDHAVCSDHPTIAPHNV